MDNKKRKILTLCIIHQHPRVLLGMKKRGFGQGKWNGFGGKVHEGETIEEAARRELYEEAGVEAVDLEKLGILEFEFKGGAQEILEGHIFKVNNIKGEPGESEEMRPQWFDVDKIPFMDMWADDEYWFPLFLAGKKFKGRFIFDGGDGMLERELVEVEKI